MNDIKRNHLFSSFFLLETEQNTREGIASVLVMKQLYGIFPGDFRKLIRDSRRGEDLVFM